MESNEIILKAIEFIVKASTPDHSPLSNLSGTKDIEVSDSSEFVYTVK